MLRGCEALCSGMRAVAAAGLELSAAYSVLFPLGPGQYLCLPLKGCLGMRREVRATQVHHCAGAPLRPLRSAAQTLTGSVEMRLLD